jgi:hypothetical protein
MYNEAKLKSLQELRGMLDGEMLGKLKKPGAPQEALPGEMPPMAPEAAAPAPEQEDPATLQALLEAYGKDEEELAQPPVPITGVN